MPYLIDGNNLAGRLRILSEPGFDQELIDLAKQYFSRKNQRAVIVFDSNDPLGDRYRDDDLTIIYTPKDAVYANADDKIIEIMKNEKLPQDWVVVSDDMHIIDEAGKLDIEVILARDFAKKLLPDLEVIDDDELSDVEQDEITDELMNEWNT
ncbi:MAG: hypothetical protein Q8Q23_06620 [bacterium]|nr:hypothetical protein [bacterium]